MKRIAIISLLMFCAAATYAQSVKNIVPNPGFEEYNKCPDDFSQVAMVGMPQQYLRNWYAPNRGSTDFYNSCAWDPRWVDVPRNIGGYTYAKEQNGYAGFYVFINTDTASNDFVYREYLEVQLSEPLRKDVSYCISFYVTPMDTNGQNPHLSMYVSKNIGAYLSRDPVVDTGSMTSYSNLPYQPQVFADKVISDTSGWTLISGVYKAVGGEEWLTIGNFDDDINTRPLQLIREGFKSNIWANFCYYFIDQVSVYALDKVLALPNESVYKVCDMFPAPVTAEAGFNNYRWSTGDAGQTVAVPDTGFYWVEAEWEGCAFRDTVQVVAVPPPVVDLGPDIELCEEGKLKTVTLKNTEPLDNFFWSNGLLYDSITTNRPGKYTLTARHICGEITDEIELNGCESTLYVPNVITPESGDENALFLPQGKNISLQLLEIYDHWGRLIYREEPPAAGWDGKVGGRLVQPGVFVWRLQYQQNDLNKVIEKIGDLTVIR